MASLGSAWFYYRAANRDSLDDQKIGRRLFQFQTAAVVGIFAVLFWIIFKHRYEYYYAWRHSSNSLPVYYMISCFWEGQEGSFLLWMFWNAVLGLIIIRGRGIWESPVMAVLAFTQFGLSTMILGLGQGSADWPVHIGSSPFDLLREQRPDLLQIPIMGQVGVGNYLQIYKDGNGLNQLLQNYWMVIHPPTLFLGFATAMVPFAYSIAGLWKGSERGWISPALTWSLVCVGILGAGIIMGGFWAYESLSFGGYWAWDPVENASLMPWLIMAAAAHMLLISKGTGRHLFTSHFLTQLAFWLVLYATFLTRSGILGEASVHSFTDLGLSGQLLIFLFSLMLLSVLSVLENPIQRWFAIQLFVGVVVASSLLVVYMPAASQASLSSVLKWTGVVLFVVVLGLFIRTLYMRTRTDQEDEKWLSRELWMFIGAMFLILSLVQVFSATSIPVFNKLFGFTKAPAKPEEYNALQLWLAMPVMMLMAIGQYFRWRDTDKQQLLKDAALAAGVSLVVTVLFNLGFGITDFKYLLFLFMSVLLLVGNVLYLRKLQKLSWLAWGGSVAHAGFGILLMGVLVSSVNQKTLTASEGIRFANEVSKEGKVDERAVKFNRENIVLYKDKPVTLGEFQATYRGYVTGTGPDSIDKYFNVLFVRKGKNGQITDSFALKPKTQNNPKMGLLAEPSTRHFIHRDIFTHVNYESSLEKQEPFSDFKEQMVVPGETFLTSSGKTKLRIDSIIPYKTDEGLNVIVKVACENPEEKWVMYPVFRILEDQNTIEPDPAVKNEYGLLVMVTYMDVPAEGARSNEVKFTVRTAERTPVKEYIVLKAIEFPWINLVWAGTIIMVIGFAMAVWNRIRLQRAMPVS